MSEAEKDNKAYRYIAVAIKILLILTGIMVMGTVAIFLLMHKSGKSIVLRNLGIGSIISVAGALGLAAICAVAGAWMESHLHGFFR